MYKSRALGVKVDRRSQSQPAGLEQGAFERTKVLVFKMLHSQNRCFCQRHYLPDAGSLSRVLDGKGGRYSD